MKKNLKSLYTKIITVIMAIFIVVLISVEYSVISAFSFGANRLVPIYNVETDKKEVAISFDAAWGADKTLKILNILDEYKIKATFFLVGFWIDTYPDMVLEISLRGHEIGTHSETHPKMSTLTRKQVEEELKSSCAKITKITGKEVKVFRPPFGDYNNQLLEVCNTMNLKAIQWNVDSLDWKGISANEIATRVQKAKSGSIILCHNNSEHIVEALPVIITSLTSKGLSFVKMSDLLIKGDYVIDSQGTMKTVIK